MVECDSHETNNMFPNLSAPLSDQEQFKLNKINETKDYFVAEIKERELMNKGLRKYIASFDYFQVSIDNPFIALSVTTGSISVALFATIIGAPVGMASASFSFSFLISIGIEKKKKKTAKSNKK